MANNLTMVLKTGEIGTVRTITLTSAGSPAILSGKTVTMTARKSLTATPVLDDVACTVTNAASGIITFTTNSTSSALSVGEYLLEFKVTSSGVEEHFPRNANGEKTYGKLIVQKSL